MTFLSNSYKFFSKPWLHFVLLGIILNDISGRIFPPSAPVIGPLSTERISTLQRQWMDVTRTVPTPLQLKSMIKSELDIEITLAGQDKAPVQPKQHYYSLRKFLTGFTLLAFINWPTIDKARANNMRTMESINGSAPVGLGFGKTDWIILLIDK